VRETYLPFARAGSPAAAFGGLRRPSVAFPCASATERIPARAKGMCQVARVVRLVVPGSTKQGLMRHLIGEARLAGCLLRAGRPAVASKPSRRPRVALNCLLAGTITLSPAGGLRRAR
jgi:hypothetical protein